MALQVPGFDIRRTIRPAKPPDTQIRVAPPELGDMGKGLRAVGKAAEKTMVVAAEIQEREQKKADRVAITRGINKKNELLDKKLYGENGFFNKKGADTFNGTVEVSDIIKDIDAEVSSGFATEHQRVEFMSKVGRFNRSLMMRTHGHISRERAVYELATMQAGIKTQRNIAVNVTGTGPGSEGLIQESIDEQILLFTEWTEGKGISTEVKKAKAREIESLTRVAVINELIAQGEDVKAEIYFKKHRKGIIGSAKSELAKQVEVSSVRGSATRYVDILMKTQSKAKGALEGDTVNKTEALAIIRGEKEFEGGKNHKKRDEIVRRTHLRFNERDAAIKAGREVLFNELSLEVRYGKSVQDIDVGLWSKLTDQQRSILENIEVGQETAEVKARQLELNAGNDAWDNFMTYVVDSTTEQVASESYEKLMARTVGMSIIQRGKAEKVWLDAVISSKRASDRNKVSIAKRLLKAKEDKAKQKFTDVTTRSIKAYKWRIMGGDARSTWDDENRTRADRFAVAFGREVQAREELTGKSMDPADLAELENKVFSRRVWMDVSIKPGGDPQRISLLLQRESATGIPYVLTKNISKRQMLQLFMIGQSGKNPPVKPSRKASVETKTVHGQYGTSVQVPVRPAHKSTFGVFKSSFGRPFLNPTSAPSRIEKAMGVWYFLDPTGSIDLVRDSVIIAKQNRVVAITTGIRRALSGDAMSLDVLESLKENFDRYKLQ